MFPRVLYVDEDIALELDWVGFGSLQTRNRYGVVRRARPQQKHTFLEVIRLFQAHGQPVHPSNPRCSRLMAEFANMLEEPPNSLAWRAMLQADLQDLARAFAEDGSPRTPSAIPPIVREAARDTQSFMTQASAALGAMPRAMLNDPFVVGSIASHTANVLHHLTNGQCPPDMVNEATISALQLSFIGTSVSKEEAERALQEHRHHKDYRKATEVVTLILGARFGHNVGQDTMTVREMQSRVRAMPRAFREALGSTEPEQVATLLSQEHFVKPLKEKYGELWRSGGTASQSTGSSGTHARSENYRAPIHLILPSFLPVIIERGLPGYAAALTALNGEKRLNQPQLRALLAASAFMGVVEHAGRLNFDADRVEVSLTGALREVPDLSVDERGHAQRLIDLFFKCKIIREEHSFDDWLCEVWWSEFQTIPYEYPSAMAGAVAYGLGIRQSLSNCTLEY
jgi:hypothetical protein